MVLNEFGEIAKNEWKRTFQIRRELTIDEYVIMPNHFHAVVLINDSRRGDPPVAPDKSPGINIHQSKHSPIFNIAVYAENMGDPPVAPTKPRPNGLTKPRPNGPKPLSIGAILAGFKSSVTKQINQKRKTPGNPVWQRDYYDHIGRDEKDLRRIREYIRKNLSNWDDDDENPLCKSPRYVALPNPQKMKMHYIY